MVLCGVVSQVLNICQLKSKYKDYCVEIFMRMATVATEIVEKIEPANIINCEFEIWSW